MKSIKTVLWLLVVLYSKTALCQSVNLGIDIYQNGIIYLKNNDPLTVDILVYKRDTLHDASVIKYKVKGDKQKINISQVDSVKLGRYMYTKFKYGNASRLGVLIKNCGIPVYVSHWVDDYGYTFVDDKANYMTYDFYVLKNGKYVKVERKRSFITMSTSPKGSPNTRQLSTPKAKVKEHKPVINELKKLFPDCDALDIDPETRVVTYKDVPELVKLAHESCVRK